MRDQKHVGEMDFSETITFSCYNNKQKILLVGEGDFSFSLCLAKAFGSATNMTATSLDTREELERKYKNAKENVEKLKSLGCTVVHGVNVHSMNTEIRVGLWIRYDRIIFNFPHAGFHFGREHETNTIREHKELVRGFLRSAKEMLKDDKEAEIHVTHKTAHPFSSWDIKNLEKSLYCYGEMEFSMWLYPGYSNKRGSGSESDSSFPVGASSTFMFRKHRFI